MNAEDLARIDSALAEEERVRAQHGEGAHSWELTRDAHELLRSARALIPEPATDDERAAVMEWAVSYFGDPDEKPEDYAEFADALTSSPVWRNRHRGPITDALREYAERLGVDSNPEHDDDPWWQGYRQAQRDNQRAALEAAEVHRA
jgi:hypothetical protein